MKLDIQGSVSEQPAFHCQEVGVEEWWSWRVRWGVCVSKRKGEVKGVFSQGDLKMQISCHSVDSKN